MLKEPLEAVGCATPDAGGEGEPRLSFSAHRSAIVLGGTKLLQHAPGAQPASLQPPGGGAVGLVLRTGFYSSQVNPNPNP